MRAVLLLLLSLLAASPAAAQPDAAHPDPWAEARAPGVVILMRHAIAPGVGDPDNFRLGDCATQRNLDESGRAQARRIGTAMREAGVAVDLVLTSQWCRAQETARLLAIAPVEAEPALNSFFEDRANAETATAALRARLQALKGRKALLITHQVNITALTGINPASGEIVLVGLDPTGKVTVRGRIALR